MSIRIQIGLYGRRIVMSGHTRSCVSALSLLLKPVDLYRNSIKVRRCCRDWIDLIRACAVNVSGYALFWVLLQNVGIRPVPLKWILSRLDSGFLLECYITLSYKVYSSSKGTVAILKGKARGEVGYHLVQPQKNHVVRKNVFRCYNFPGVINAVR